MENKELKIMLLKSRISLLSGRGPQNNSIIKKLNRKLRKLEN